MLWKTNIVHIAKEKLIKTAIFSIVGLFTIIISLTWLSRERTFDEFEKSRISTYNRLDSLVGKIISASNNDSLVKWSAAFAQGFYDRETIPSDDSATLLAIRRFKFELNDKISGTTNILEPTKFEKTGRDIMRACEIQVARTANNPGELAKND